MQYSQEHLKTMVYAKFGGANRVYYGEFENRELPMQEWRDESEIYNFQWIQLSSNKFVNYGILGGGRGSFTWHDCNTCTMGGMTVNVLCSGWKCEPIEQYLPTNL